MASGPGTISSRPRAGWASNVRSTPPKLATTVADHIVADIIERGWPIGEVLGSEPELLERYGVSRAVFREAVRLVEHQQIVTMRRGPGGGLVISSPGRDAIADALQLTLYRTGARFDEVFEAREIIELLAVKIVASLPEEARARAVEAVRAEPVRHDHRSFHVGLARATQNPALELFVELLARVTHLYLSDRELVTSATVSDAMHAHDVILDAISRGDVAAASRRMARHLEAERAFLQEHHTARQLVDPSLAVEGSPSAKLADDVARQILRSVVEQHRQPGELLGSEGELMERFGVSRAIVREAVQLLEHYDVAAMRRGPGGGLIVIEPNMTAVTDVIALYLEFHGISARDVFEVRVDVELAMVDRLAQAMDLPTAEGLAAALVAEEASGDDLRLVITDLHVVAASLAGNQVLKLVTIVLINLCELHERAWTEAHGGGEVSGEVHRAHRAIVQSLIGADRETARRRMRRHLEELSRFYD